MFFYKSFASLSNFKTQIVFFVIFKMYFNSSLLLRAAMALARNRENSELEKHGSPYCFYHFQLELKSGDEYFCKIFLCLLGGNSFASGSNCR